MGSKVAWSLHEAVILLDGYIDSLKGDVSRLRIIKRVSADLRKMAVNNGMNIDDIYRNENGISFQLDSMKTAYGESTAIKPSRLFTETVALYRNNREQYEKLLEEAKSMIDGKFNYKASFLSWLATTNPSISILTFLGSYNIIEQFCMKYKILSVPLFETTNIDTLNLAFEEVSQNTIFRMEHKSHIGNLDLAVHCLNRYIKDGNLEKVTIKSIPSSPAPIDDKKLLTTNVLQPTHTKEPNAYVKTEKDKWLLNKYANIYKCIFDLLYERYIAEQNGITIAELYEKTNHVARCSWIEDILDNASWATSDKMHYTFSEEIFEPKDEDFFKTQESHANAESNNTNQAERTVNFNAIGDFSHTKPTGLNYFADGIIHVSTWAGLYIELFSMLYSDYPLLFHAGMAFSGNGAGRVDLVDEALHSTLIAPKSIPHTSLFLETNLSAKSTLRKIKFLLDYCNIDYENIVIEYREKCESQITSYVSHEQLQLPDYGHNFNCREFSLFLNNHEGMAESKSRKYVSSINTAESFAKEHQYKHQHLLTTDLLEAQATVDALLFDPAFIDYNKQYRFRLSIAIRNLLPRLRAYATNAAHSAQPPEADSFYREVLIEYFYKGFRLCSPIECRKFKRYYEQLANRTLNDSDAEIDCKVCTCGIQFEDKIFTPQTMLSEELSERLFAYIRNSFDEGKTALYYQALFNQFSEEFLDYYIYNADMLKAYLSYMLGDDYFFNKSYLSKTAYVTVDAAEEIRTCLKEYAAPTPYDILFSKLSHIPQKKIKQILASNSEFINNGSGEYFHVSAVNFSDAELGNIADIISMAINDKEFLSGSELINAIKSKYPYICEKNQAFSTVGMRDAIRNHLCRQFSFSGNIISKSGVYLTMPDVFADFCNSRDEFTIDELQVLAGELGTGIYFEPVYENSLRINHDCFVSKERAHFLVAETDAALDRFCTGDYISIGKIFSFGILPDAGFPWNSFLLEHYVAVYSQKYCLLHIGFNSNKCVGAIAKRSAQFESFDDCMVEVLANSNVMLKKQSALQYLCDEGYIGRRSYTNIEELLIKATAQRNRKEAN